MNKKLLIIVLVLLGLGTVIISLTVSITIPFALDDDDEVENQDADPHKIDVVTREATMISTVFTTLNGELVNLGNYSSVEVYFVWGEGPGEYSKETPKQSMTSPGEFSAEISDLFMPDNTYYFQARSDPEGRGEEVSFYVN